MGFSTIAAGAILFVGVLFLGGTVANAWFETARSDERGRADRNARDVHIRETDLRLDSLTWQGNRVHVYVTNTGGTVLEVSKVHVFIDGAWGNGLISQSRVDGQPNVNHWAPGEQLYLRVDASPKPTRVWAVTETGQGVVGVI